MRILIYSESETAKAKLAELRKEGHHASLRNPHYFDPAQFDKTCDMVVTDDPAILDAYAAAGIDAQRLTPQETAEEREPPVEPEPEPEPMDTAEPPEQPAKPRTASPKGRR